jgi:predicted amidohydrolase YtcJ
MRLGRACALALAILAAAPFAAAAQAPDAVLINGKVVTVDDRFTIAQALAIKDGRILKVGTTAEIDALKGASTRTIDLGGRTVIPGLIDNHAHWVRAAEHDELRFDGVTSRRQALEMLAERARKTPPGVWIVVLGGWSEEQFTDDPRGFPLEELDRIAPNNPVVLQAVYNHSYLNSVALVAEKIDASTPDPQGGKIEKDADGKPTGLVRGPGGVAFVAARIPLESQEAWLANTRKLVAYLNSLGITAWLDAGGRGMGAKHYEPYKHLADRGELNVRLFWTAIRQPVMPFSTSTNPSTRSGRSRGCAGRSRMSTRSTRHSSSA